MGRAGLRTQPARCTDCGDNAAGGAKGRCGRCYAVWRRSWQQAGSPPPPADTPRPPLRSGWYGYSPATGTARLEAS